MGSLKKLFRRRKRNKSTVEPSPATSTVAHTLSDSALEVFPSGANAQVEVPWRRDGPAAMKDSETAKSEGMIPNAESVTLNTSTSDVETKPVANDEKSDVSVHSDKIEEETESDDDLEQDYEPDGVKVEEKTPAKYVVHAQTVLYGVAALNVALLMVVVKYLKPGLWEVLSFMWLGFIAGVLYSYTYRLNVQKKQETAKKLNLVPGVKGLSALLGQSPPWLSYREKEKAEWLNKMLREMWPFYDKAICDTIKDVVEPIMEDVRPPIFKFIGFKKITFGDVPFRVEGVCCERMNGEISMDIDLRWSGDSNITLVVEPNLPGEVTRMAPKITDISLVGTVRVMYKPLCSVIPCFGAVVVSLLQPPMLKFKVDMGRALGGPAVGASMERALSTFLKDTLVNMLIWPQRLVSPMLDEKDCGPLSYLELRSVGLLTVEIVRARGLPAADMNGVSDPMVEVYTEPKRKFSTKVIKRTLDPVWEEEVKYLFVQEPRSQYLYVNVYDIDVFNAKNLVKNFNVIKGIKESVGSKDFLGRCQVPISRAAAHPGMEIDEWYDLKAGEWGADIVQSPDVGRLRLKITYRPFEMLKPDKSQFGAVIVKLLRCRNLKAMDSGGTSDPYVRVKLTGKEYRTHVVKCNLNPEYHLTYEWWDVAVDEELKVKVFDKDFGVGNDDFLGEVYLPVSDIAKHVSKNGEAGVWRDWFPLDDIEHGEVEMDVRFIPFDA